MIDFDEIEQWAGSLSAAQAENIPNAVRNKLVTSSPPFIEDTLDTLFTLTSRARGGVPQMIEKFISVWSYRLAHPSFDPKRSRVAFDMAVNTAVPPSWIRRIEILQD